MVKYPYLAMPNGTLRERLKYGLSAKAHAPRTRLICRCSVGYTHCWVSGTKSGLSLTQRLEVLLPLSPRGEPAQPSHFLGQLLFFVHSCIA